jgi:CXXC-20-CXXC protein
MANCPECQTPIQQSRLVFWSPQKDYRCLNCSARLTVHEHWNKLVFFLMWVPLVPVTRYSAEWWQSYRYATLLVIPVWALVVFLASYLHKVVKAPVSEA